MDADSPISEKAEYVRRQRQSRHHICHWPGCDKQVPPAMWGCRTHWFKLPKHLRTQIWLHYNPGQENSMRPSATYIEVTKSVQKWIEENYES